MKLRCREIKVFEYWNHSVVTLAPFRYWKHFRFKSHYLPDRLRKARGHADGSRHHCSRSDDPAFQFFQDQIWNIVHAGLSLTLGGHRIYEIFGINPANAVSNWHIGGSNRRLDLSRSSLPRIGGGL